MANDSLIRPPINPVQPGAFSAVDASALRNADLRSGDTVAVVGQTLGGAPNTPMYFRGLGPLKNVLRGGQAYDCARFALSVGAPRVAVVRVGTSIARGTLALAGATGNPLIITAIDYGAWTNTIKVAVVATNQVVITFTDSFGVVYTETFTGASLQAIADAINGKTLGIPGSQYVTASVTTGALPLTPVSATALASGSDGTAPDATAWNTGFTALETELVDIVVAATGDAAIHASLATHCDAMSLPAARRERVQISGAVTGESVAAQVTRVGNLRRSRFQLVYPGVYAFNDAGVLTLYDPFYAAAIIAGMHAALTDPAQALTHDPVPVAVDVEKQLSSIQGGDLDTLLTAGVTPIAPNGSGGLWLTDSLATYNTDDTFRDIHKIRSADRVQQRLRRRMEDEFTGAKTLDGLGGEMIAVGNQELEQLKTEGIIRAHQGVEVQPGANVRSTNINAKVMLVDTQKFIFISVALMPPSLINQSAGAVAPDLLA